MKFCEAAWYINHMRDILIDEVRVIDPDNYNNKLEQETNNYLLEEGIEIPTLSKDKMNNSQHNIYDILSHSRHNINIQVKTLKRILDSLDASQKKEVLDLFKEKHCVDFPLNTITADKSINQPSPIIALVNHFSEHGRELNEAAGTIHQSCNEFFAKIIFKNEPL